ncbi:MAG: hypothetical protein AB8G05_11520 [Oligoflexales bacterium]
MIIQILQIEHWKKTHSLKVDDEKPSFLDGFDLENEILEKKVTKKTFDYVQSDGTTGEFDGYEVKLPGFLQRDGDTYLNIKCEGDRNLGGHLFGKTLVLEQSHMNSIRESGWWCTVNDYSKDLSYIYVMPRSALFSSQI